LGIFNNFLNDLDNKQEKQDPKEISIFKDIKSIKFTSIKEVVEDEIKDEKTEKLHFSIMLYLKIKYKFYFFID